MYIILTKIITSLISGIVIWQDGYEGRKNWNQMEDNQVGTKLLQEQKGMCKNKQKKQTCPKVAYNPKEAYNPKG